MSPKVSVIIITYNRARLLSRAINSVLSQTFTDFELIIVDDCSRDNTQEIISGFEDYRISQHRHRRNKGLSAARNTGIVNARGDFIAFLDDDDEWLPKKLQLQVSLLEASTPQVALVHGWHDSVRDSSGRLIRNKRSMLAGDVFESLIALNGISPIVTALVRASVIREVGGFDERYAYGEDTNLICRISRRYHVALLPEVVVRVHNDHGYSRQTDPTPENAARHVDFRRKHLKDFEDQLRDRPKAHASVLRQLAFSEILCLNRLAALLAYASAVKLDPIGARFGISGDTWRLFRTFIWHATPLSRFREQAKAIRRLLPWFSSH